ncbi:MAG: GAF domain-containing protein [Anaerolineae bacterium]|nr:GAF domain-containing protein [Anaerolineae bacterium]
MRRNLDGQRRELEALSSISVDISSALDMEQVLTRALQQVAALTPLDAAAIFLTDPDQPGDMRLAKELRLRVMPAPLPETMPSQPDSTAGTIIATRQAVFVADTLESTHFSFWWERYKMRAGAVVPLIARDRVIGVLNLIYLSPHPFDPLETTLLKSVGHQLAVALDNAHLLARERRQRRVAEALREVASMVSSAQLGDVLYAVLDQLRGVLAYDRATVLLVAQPGLLRIGAHRGFEDQANTEFAEARRIEIAHIPNLDRVINQGEPVLVTDIGHQDANWMPGAFEYKSWIGVPLKIRGQVLGCLSLTRYKSADHFTPHDLVIVKAFASQAVIAVENTRLFQAEQQRRVHAEILREASYDLVVSATMDGALTAALKHLNRLVPFDRAHIGLIHPDSGSWLPSVSHPADKALPPELAAIVGDFPLAQAVITSRRALLVSETRTDPRWQPEQYGQQEVRCWMGAPLVLRDRVIGMMVMDGFTPGAFDVEQLQTAQVFANQISAAVENFRLRAETVRQNRTLDVLNTVLATGTEALTRDNLLALSLERVLEVLQLGGGVIHQRDPAADKLRLRAAAGLPPAVVDQIREAPLSEGLPAIHLPSGESYTFHSIALLAHGVKIGLLSVYENGQTALHSEWDDLLARIGQQLGVVMDNATLFEEVRRRLDHLNLVNEVSRYATAILSVDSLIEGVAGRLFDTLDYDTISLIQVKGTELTVNAFFAYRQPLPLDSLPARYTMPDGVAALAVSTGLPHSRNQTLDLPLPEPIQTPLDCCTLAIPLLLADEVIGALVVERQGHDSITQADQDVLEPLASQLAISVSNAHLFETVRQQAADLEIRVAARTTEIREQKERTEAILRSVADAVIVFDLNGHVLLTNPAARSLFEQYDLDYDLGTHVRALMAASPAADTDTNSDTPPETIALGPVTLQAKASRVMENGNVLGTVVVLRDITRQHELDRLRDQFVSTASHELRTPLANLKLYLSLLTQGPPERRADYLDVLNRETRRMVRLVDNLLQISRLQSQRQDERPLVREPVRLDALINTVIANHAAQAEQEQITVKHDARTVPLPVIQGDEDQLVRALTNLINNAIHYTPAGGRVIIRSRTEFIERELTECVKIEVIDNGIGIPADELPMIFERFYRGSNVDPAIPGTGLGLAIIKDIVELHGGSIEVESIQDHGSTFRLTLPV